MPPRVQKQRPRRPKRRNARTRNQAHENRAATHASGVSAQGALVSRVPIFNRASKRVRLPYYEYQLSRAGVAGAQATYFFTANGCFDPNITGTGHQPMGFDTMMMYYEQYCVMASKITVCFVNNGNQSVRIGIALTPDTTAPVIGEIVENGLIVMGVLDATISDAAHVGGGRNRIRTLSSRCDCATYFGRKTSREMLNDTSLQGTIAANPTEQVYYAVTTWGGHFANDTSVQFDVILEYDVIFWEPRKLSQQLERDLHNLLIEEEKHEKKTSAVLVTVRR